MIVCIHSPPRLPMMQNQKSLTRHWLSCSGWGRELVSLAFGYKCSQLIRKGQWRTKVNILRLAVGYLNATMNRKTRNTEPEIATNGSTQTLQHQWIDRYRSRFGPPRGSNQGFWTVLEWIEPFLQSDPGQLAGFPDPVLTLIILHLQSSKICTPDCHPGGS